jgi:hypothetical protein
MSNLYINIFDPPRLNVWNRLGEVPISCVLGGGTAIALQLGHRISYDFDIFLVKSVPRNLMLKLRSAFPDASIQTQVDSGDELSVTVDGVRLTYLYYPFPARYPTVPTGSLPILDLRDCAANKAYTIGRRGAWRDYFDLFTLCTQAALSLESIVADAHVKFEGLFNAKLFLEQLTYFADISDFSIEPLNASPAKPDDILSFFRKEAETFLE